MTASAPQESFEVVEVPVMPVPAGLLLLLRMDESGGVAGWQLFEDGASRAAGGAGDPLPNPVPVRTALAVPGTNVALHWLDLPPELTQAQAAGAARLAAAELTAEPIADLHVAAGGREGERTIVGLVPADLMSAWLASAAALGIDPDLVVPEPLLLPVEVGGVVQAERGDWSDYRGLGLGFSMEPELAALLPQAAGARALSLVEEDVGLAGALANPMLNLRQGPFAKRRRLTLSSPRVRRLVLMGLALLLLTLAVQIVTIVRHTFAADQVEAQAAAIAAQSRGAGVQVQARPSFGPAAAAVFQALQSTPNAELRQLGYSGGALSVVVQADSPATLDLVRSRIAEAGLQVVPGLARADGGRAVQDLTVRS